MECLPHWPLDVVLAEDTPSDIELYHLAVERIGTLSSLHVVNDGQEMIEFLCGKLPDTGHWPRPNFLLLDLKMPRCDGFDVLRWLKGHPECAIIPTIIVSNSEHENDIKLAYELGANAFFVKPSQLSELVGTLRIIFDFWSTAKHPEPIAVCR
jgi:CheY-like chemotaxis protein